MAIYQNFESLYRVTQSTSTHLWHVPFGLYISVTCNFWTTYLEHATFGLYTSVTCTFWTLKFLINTAINSHKCTFHRFVGFFPLKCTVINDCLKSSAPLLCIGKQNTSKYIWTRRREKYFRILASLYILFETGFFFSTHLHPEV